MFEKIKECGNWFRSLSGWWYFGIVIVPAILTITSGIYESIGLTASIALTMCTLVIGIILIICIIHLKEMLFLSHNAIPILEVFKISKKCGWNLRDANHDILDLCHALEEAGLNGHIKFEGSKDGIDEEFLRMNYKESIPKEHWRDFDIDWTNAFIPRGSIDSGYKADNFNIRSSGSFGIRTDGDYNDLHVYHLNIKKWLRNSAKMHKGRHNKIDAKNNL